MDNKGQSGLHLTEEMEVLREQALLRTFYHSVEASTAFCPSCVGEREAAETGTVRELAGQGCLCPGQQSGLHSTGSGGKKDAGQADLHQE